MLVSKADPCQSAKLPAQPPHVQPPVHMHVPAPTLHNHISSLASVCHRVATDREMRVSQQTTKTAICKGLSATPMQPPVCVRISTPTLHNPTTGRREILELFKPSFRGQNRTAGSSALVCQHGAATIGAREIGVSCSYTCTHASQPPQVGKNCTCTQL